MFPGVKNRNFFFFLKSGGQRPYWGREKGVQGRGLKKELGVLKFPQKVFFSLFFWGTPVSLGGFLKKGCGRQNFFHTQGFQTLGGERKEQKIPEKEERPPPVVIKTPGKN